MALACPSFLPLLSTEHPQGSSDLILFLFSFLFFVFKSDALELHPSDVTLMLSRKDCSNSTFNPRLQLHSALFVCFNGMRIKKKLHIQKLDAVLIGLNWPVGRRSHLKAARCARVTFEECFPCKKEQQETQSGAAPFKRLPFSRNFNWPLPWRKAAGNATSELLSTCEVRCKSRMDKFHCRVSLRGTFQLVLHCSRVKELRATSTWDH